MSASPPRPQHHMLDQTWACRIWPNDVRDSSLRFSLGGSEPHGYQTWVLRCPLFHFMVTDFRRAGGATNVPQPTDGRTYRRVPMVHRGSRSMLLCWRHACGPVEKLKTVNAKNIQVWASVMTSAGGQPHGGHRLHRRNSSGSLASLEARWIEPTWSQSYQTEIVMMTVK